MTTTMQPDPRFTKASPVFWANVRTISEAVGYTDRATGKIRVHTPAEIATAYTVLSLSSEHLFAGAGLRPTEMGQLLLDYFEHRKTALTEVAEPNLMDVEEARIEFASLQASLRPRRAFAMNKQKGEKKGPAYLTGLVNMVVESKVGEDCDFDPRRLTTVTRDGLPVRTLARRVDGAYPSTVNPVAVWEIKEYYFTTTFGSRVADGVYETLLDGMELQELREEEHIDVRHYLIIDSHLTWWQMGKSYLCRMVDMLHLGLVDEVLFGREVITRLPVIMDELIALRRSGLADDHPADNGQLDLSV